MSEIVAWMDRWWDDGVGLLRYPSEQPPGGRPVHLVRESAWYALGLLARNDDGDEARARAALRSVLAHQIDAPGSVVHGTWRRSPEEAPPPAEDPIEWIHYDPNWREFIGTTLALVLARFEARLPGALVADLEAALGRAAAGSFARAVDPDYTNVALSSALLLDVAGHRLGKPAWRLRGEALAQVVARDYRERGAFLEHNSPTYYGTDLAALALWRELSSLAWMREEGAALEALLWRDLARFYHAGLRNLCGPYTRAYGMDMTRYVAGLGLAIALGAPEAPPPLPAPGDRLQHAHDLCKAPVFELLGVRVPDDVMPHLHAFQRERVVEQLVGGADRVVTAWLGEDAMVGGEWSRRRYVHHQHHPATAHWQIATGGVGTLRIVTPAPVDARASAGRLDVVVHAGPAWLRASEVELALELAPAAEAAALGGDPQVWAGGRLHCQASTGPPMPLACPEPGRARLGWRFAAGKAPERVELTLTVA